MTSVALALLCCLTTGAWAQAPFEPTTPGHPGSGGLVPTLTGAGPLSPGSASNDLLLTGGLPGSVATLVLGFSEWAQPFHGGVLGPAPDVLVPGLPLDSAGSLGVPCSLPRSLPAGSSIWAQFWILDPAAASGRSSSNSLALTIQPTGGGRRPSRAPA